MEAQDIKSAEDKEEITHYLVQKRNVDKATTKNISLAKNGEAYILSIIHHLLFYQLSCYAILLIILQYN